MSHGFHIVRPFRPVVRSFLRHRVSYHRRYLWASLWWGPQLGQSTVPTFRSIRFFIPLRSFTEQHLKQLLVSCRVVRSAHFTLARPTVLVTVRAMNTLLFSLCSCVWRWKTPGLAAPATHEREALRASLRVVTVVADRPTLMTTHVYIGQHITQLLLPDMWPVEQSHGLPTLAQLVKEHSLTIANPLWTGCRTHSKCTTQLLSKHFEISQMPRIVSSAVSLWRSLGSKQWTFETRWDNVLQFHQQLKFNYDGGNIKGF